LLPQILGIGQDDDFSGTQYEVMEFRGDQVDRVLKYDPDIADRGLIGEATGCRHQPGQVADNVAEPSVREQPRC
jgi:hypothetical protein